MKRFALLVLVAGMALIAAEQKSRSWQLTEINAKIAELQKQLDFWEEKKRQLLETPDNPAAAKEKSDQRVYTGPRNGKYHYSPSGRRVYERKFLR